MFDGKNKGNQWCTWVVVYCKDKKIAIGSYYRSPSARSSNIDNNKTMADICNIKKEIEYIKKNQEVSSFIVGGDTNTCSSIWDKNYDDKNLNGVNEVLDFMVENVLTSCVLIFRILALVQCSLISILRKVR